METDDSKHTSAATALPPPGNSRSLLARPHATSLEASLSPWGIVGSIFHLKRNKTRSSRSESTRSSCRHSHRSSPPRSVSLRKVSVEQSGPCSSHCPHSPSHPVLGEVGVCRYGPASFPLKKILFFKLKEVLERHFQIFLLNKKKKMLE